MDEMPDLQYPLSLILRELDDIKILLRDLSTQIKEHVDDDDSRFQELRDVMINWRGIAAVIVLFVSALVSAIVGLVVKHF